MGAMCGAIYNFTIDAMNDSRFFFFDSKKCILLQHTCGISIATMIASEKGWRAGAGIRYFSTRRIRIQQRKNTHLLAVTIVFRISVCVV